MAKFPRTCPPCPDFYARVPGGEEEWRRAFEVMEELARLSRHPDTGAEMHITVANALLKARDAALASEPRVWRVGSRFEVVDALLLAMGFRTGTVLELEGGEAVVRFDQEPSGIERRQRVSLNLLRLIA